MESISAFEIIKVGVGPSSSHTMGPWSASERFINRLRRDGNLTRVTQVSVWLYGSLAKTGYGHGTDVAVLMGLSGEDFTKIDTSTIPEKVQQIKTGGMMMLGGEHPIGFDYNSDLVFEFGITLDFHPNGMKIRAMLHDESIVEETYFSIGGGFVVKDGQTADEIINDSKVTPYPCHSARDILNNCRRLNLRVSELVLLNEQTWRSAEEIRVHALHIWDEIKQCVFRGVHRKGVLPGSLNVRRRAYELSKKQLGGRKFADVDAWIEAIRTGPQDFRTVNKWVSIFALAVNEENASFGRIVTAPTNGASGVIPAVLMYAWCFVPHVDEDAVVDFLLTAGEIGTLYKKGATISAAMGGCQAEIGVSSSMAAAALTEILGGTKEQVMQAAEIAMEHHLGMTCDPIGGLVQIPCIERNSMGAMKAITASNIALDEDPTAARVSLDDVIKTMWETARDMNTKYKETSEGGLAVIPVNVIEC
ncbi:MAG: L-serine ammonia-lyase [Bacteroidetes bacterium]|nr:L-serine ammonia-lyase [Bacteroidota bacterium]MCH8523916.1 L-serine ammonia-lyase [Balneolales bacterium]